MHFFLISLMLTGIPWCDCANILGVFNHPASSHTLLGKVLLKNLALRGHNVTMISSFPLQQKLDNYHDVELPELLDDMKKRLSSYSTDKPQGGFKELKNMTLSHTEALFQNAQVRALLKSNINFDVIIIDFFYNEASWIFGHIYRAPIILMSSFGNNFLLNPLIGNTLPYSYVPGGGLPMSDDIPFKYRIIMSIYNLCFEFVLKSNFRRNHYEILTKYFDNPPSIDELAENIVLVLSNSHFSIETPRPYTPNIVPIGGFHIEKPSILPTELKVFLDDAPDGVILFSLGSQIQSAKFDQTVLEDILKTFSRLKQKILWKYESNHVLKAPKNVKIIKWMPQFDVLNHRNVKLFITHCGMLSMIESIYTAVPMLCVPFNGDQITNAEFIESRQLGRKIYINDIKNGNLFNIINDLITNTQYKNRVGYFSDLLRNQPVPPLDNAIYWVEHVVKYGTTTVTHLRPFSVQLPWYKYYMIDVILFSLIIFWIIYSTCKLSLLIVYRIISNAVRNLKQKIE